MAELPGIAPEGPITKPIQPNLSQSEIASPYVLLSEGLKKVGATADEVAVSLAKQAGAEAVTTDANGNIKVDHYPIIGPAAEAFKDTVKLAALAEGEGAARRKDIELRQQFRDNPEGYRQAADGFAKQMQAQYAKAAGPLVGISMRKAIEQQTTTTYRGLLNEHERLELHRSANALNSELEHAKNTMYALAGQGIGDGPDAPPEWTAAKQKIATIYGKFRDNPRMAFPQEQVDQETSKFYDELRVRSMQHHIVEDTYAKEPDKAKAYDEAYKKAGTVLTDPKLNLSPTQRETAYHRMISALNDRSRQDQALFNGSMKEMGAMQKTATDGYPVPPEHLAQVRTMVETSGDPRLAGALDQTERTVRFMADARKMTPDELDHTITGLRAANAPEQVIKGTEKLQENMRKELKSDPVGWMEHAGVASMPNIEFAQPGAASQMRERSAKMDVLAPKYGIASTYLKPTEVRALSEVAARGGPEAVALAKSIVDGFGDHAPAVMKQISKESPQMAHMGSLGLAGVSDNFLLDIAQGMRLRTDPELKKLAPPLTGAAASNAKNAQNERARDQYGDAFFMMPEGSDAAQLAAQDAFAAQAQRKGWDPTLGYATPQGTVSRGAASAFDRTLQESAGATFVGDQQYGGIDKYGRNDARVLVPGSVKSNRFRDVIKAITDDDIREFYPNTTFKAKDLQAAVPYALPGGRYAFAAGDVHSTDPKYLGDAQGRLVLDFSQLEGRLRQRVSTAFK